MSAFIEYILVSWWLSPAPVMKDTEPDLKNQNFWSLLLDIILVNFREKPQQVN